MLRAFKQFIKKNQKPIKLYWWRYQYPDNLNFGDEITPYIIEKLWSRKVKWADVNDCELIGAGSILDIVERRKPRQSVKIWGSGYIHEGGESSMENLDIYAVRGPLTQARVNKTREIAIGDPGLLASLVFPKSETIKYKVGILAHYVDEESPHLKEFKDNKDYLFISPLQTPAKVAQDITSCEYIVSSSLHGLIFADSFGVPNNWMPLSDKLTGGDYKFRDYYASTNRRITKVKPSILKDRNAVVKAMKKYKPISNLSALQKGLIGSFPYK